MSIDNLFTRVSNAFEFDVERITDDYQVVHLNEDEYGVVIKTDEFDFCITYHPVEAYTVFAPSYEDETPRYVIASNISTLNEAISVLTYEIVSMSSSKC